MKDNLIITQLLSMNCFPLSMEFLSSADKPQMDIIKNIIDDCDFFILIVAGRYGSIVKDDIYSYTEIEFNYAISRCIPTLIFINDNVANLPNGKCENDPNKLTLLNSFRTRLKEMGKMCSLYKTTEELIMKVGSSIYNQINDNKAIGWVRNNFPTSKSDESKNDYWKSKLIKGDSIVEVTGKYYIRTRINNIESKLLSIHNHSYKMKWDEIFSYLDINPNSTISKDGIFWSLRKHIEEQIVNSNEDGLKEDDERYISYSIDIISREKILTQLEALELLNFDYKLDFDLKNNKINRLTHYYLTDKGKNEYYRLHAMYE